ncbi:MAG: amidohydrolase family protein [Pirellulaceae bacterium]
MLTASTATFRARWVFPIESPPIQDGVVQVARGRIVSIEKYQNGQAVTDLGDVALLPGLVNAHTHLEFSTLETPLGRPGMPFADWIGEVVAARRWLTENGVDLAAYTDLAFGLGLEESIEVGVAALGEIASPDCPPASYGTVTGIRGTVFLELLGLAPERTESLLAAAREHVNRSSPNFRQGLSPHAPYTVSPELLRKVCALSAEARVPLAMHLAESMEELELLRCHSGPLVERLEDLGAWHPGQIPRGIRPADYLEMLAAAHQALIIHGSFLGTEDMDFLAARRDRMTVVYCPRTHAYFRHGEYPLAEMVARGVRVAVGTDSRASNPDLSVLSELRHIARHHPSVHPEEVLKMGAVYGAEALGIADELGGLAPGKQAAFAVVPLANAGDDPYELLFTKETIDALPLLPQARQSQKARGDL